MSTDNPNSFIVCVACKAERTKDNHPLYCGPCGFVSGRWEACFHCGMYLPSVGFRDYCTDCVPLFHGEKAEYTWPPQSHDEEKWVVCRRCANRAPQSQTCQICWPGSRDPLKGEFVAIGSLFRSDVTTNKLPRLNSGPPMARTLPTDTYKEKFEWPTKRLHQKEQAAVMSMGLDDLALTLEDEKNLESSSEMESFVEQMSEWNMFYHHLPEQAEQPLPRQVTDAWKKDWRKKVESDGG